MDLHEKKFVVGGWPVVYVPEDEFGLSGVIFSSILFNRDSIRDRLPKGSESVLEIEKGIRETLSFPNPLSVLMHFHAGHLDADSRVAVVAADKPRENKKIVLGWFEVESGHIYFKNLTSFYDDKPDTRSTGFMVL
jgi:hypothetical protein